MQLLPLVGRRRSRWTTTLLSAAALLAAACEPETLTNEASLPNDPPVNPAIQQAAFIADVDTRTGVIKIHAPAAGFQIPEGAAGPMGVDGPQKSILAGDVIQLTTSNFTASAVGAFVPGKVRVTFDVNVTNRLGSVQLITPTFPVPPVGTNGVLLFPYQITVTETSGGTSVGGDGTDVIVELPNRGAVTPSTDFDGAPHNFFNDAGCGAGSTDCYRFETFTQPLAAASTSENRTVGFDIDPTVSNFRARLIIAADLENSAGAPKGSIGGAVTSPQRGAITGATVTISGGFSANTTTGAGGAYQIDSIPTGPKTVSVSNLPAGCTIPASQGVTVSANTLSTVNFSVTCSVPTGTIGGTISSSLGGTLSGVQVTVTPTGGVALAPQASNGSGVYSVSGVSVFPNTTGSIALSNLPANCANPGAQPYSGLTEGGTLTVDFTLSCTPPPSGYQYTAVWGTPSAGQVTLTLQIDMSTFDTSAVAGPDDLGAIQGSLAYDAAKLAFVSAANVAGGGLQNLTINGGTPGVVQYLNVNTGAPATGLQAFARITFNIIGTGSTTTTSTFSVASDLTTSVDYLSKVLITEGTIVLP